MLSLARNGAARRFVAEQWDAVLFLAMLCAAVLLSGDFGGLREVLTWLAGLSLLLVVGIGLGEGELTTDGLLLTLLSVGAVLGLGAISERVLGASETWAVIPGYHPVIRGFSLELGNRASSWAGHPLRLGTASSLGVLSGWALLLRPRDGYRPLTILLVVGSGAGLVLSGARGSWLALALGAVALMLLGGAVGRTRRVLTALLLVAAGYFALTLAGLDSIIFQRIRGGAVDPTSLGQRAQVLGVAFELWLAHPWFGYGFRGISDAIYSQGLGLANYENEYVGVLLTAGIAGLASLLLLLGRTLVAGVRRPRSLEMAAAVSLFIATGVNCATYNLFGWSTGPALLLMTVGVVRGLRFVEGRSDS